MYNPVSTYRIQFNKDFNFSTFEAIIPYLYQLGIKTIYASPIFEAVPGSNHGYDELNPLRINPEIGTEEQFLAIHKRLDEYGIGWLQDIVPNHMAFHPGNKWLMDVLKNGASSQYASYFDIDYNEKLMVPFLGKPLEEVIADNEMKLANNGSDWYFDYYGNLFPLSKESSQGITDNPDIAALRKLTDRQHYRLCHWQETDSHINFRRFFTINGLICLNIQHRDVFNGFHEKIRHYSDQKLFNGLRVDHIDGLHDPSKYLTDLRELTGDDSYIVVEKILEPGESLPSYWPVQGSTGYDFLALVNNLFTNRLAEETFTRFYQELVGYDVSIHEQLRKKKAYILFNHMGGELDNLCGLFLDLHLSEADQASIPTDKLRSAIAEFLIQCPVYRYYGNCMPLEDNEQSAITAILDQVKRVKPDLRNVIDLLRHALIEHPGKGGNKYNKRALRFYQRCMQFTGPLMAKGVEDTLMYTYNRFIGHNEVGDSPGSFGITIEEFHKAMMERQRNWPLCLNATSTHDTKRGEDVRARLNVLTDVADDWIQAVNQWKALNAGFKTNGMPDDNDEYFIYQTLLGVYPLHTNEEPGLQQRLEKYIVKALREAKIHSTWTEANTEYEESAKRFVSILLDKNTAFWNSFERFLNLVKEYAVINSLSQLVLKMTCPGTPDTYQGSELWDLSMVDPDNRRPVDYTKRQKWLGEFANSTNRSQAMVHAFKDSEDGKVKLLLTHLLLQLRSSNKDLFGKGPYIPLDVTGKYKNNIIAFARRYERKWLIVALSLHTAALSTQNDGIDWADTCVKLPPHAPACWTSAVTKAQNTTLSLKAAALFAELPFTIFEAEHSQTTRSAGVLLAISSLPSKYGIGDFGENAYRFVDFLSRAGQKYWQLLPINPTDPGSGHSPYSSISSMAGNTLLIAPEYFAETGLLNASELRQYWMEESDRADYAAANTIKNELFEQAYSNYQRNKKSSFHKQCKDFEKRESYWLNDFALFVALKHKYNNEPWYKWPDEYKQRDANALQQLAADRAEEIEKIKWLQWVFAAQWDKLQQYCNALDIKLFGDIPFYVSYDSVDVWANPEIFCLDDNRNMAGIAGVPPDYFSEDGQLWGMPTFNWYELKKQNYHWWVARLKKNLEQFDLVRLDHFRAFAEYWEVPAGETTARNGDWRDGPGKEFFDFLKKELGSLPFVAEDLGDRMEPVYKLRDEIGLPGMKVLQFAFSENLHSSVDIPHNYVLNSIAYSGTHDNNTTVGWYQDETAHEDHRRLEQYTGMTVSDVNVHHVIARMVYSSVAQTAILPMQDILGLGRKSRMNTPGQAEGNWSWRVKSPQLTNDIENRLLSWVKLYNR